MDLTEKVFQANDVHQLTERLSTVLQRAIIVEDRNFELIAYSSPNEFSFDPVQQKTILTKRCPLFIIERLKKEGIIDRLKIEDRPIRLRAMEDIGFYQRVVVSLKHHNIIRGYLWIYEAEDHFEEDDISFLMQVGSHLGKILFEEQQTTEHNVQSVIWKLINDEFLNEAEIYRAANIASYNVPDQFTVMIASVKDPEYLSILDKIKNKFIEDDIAFYLGKGTEIIGIVDGTRKKSSVEKTDELKDELVALLAEKERDAVYIGIGDEYVHVRKIRKSYLEALEVIETMVFLNLDKTTLSFNELGLYRYVKLMYKKNISENYRNRKILQVMKKDAESNSELLKTMWCFLRNNCRIGRTADQLFIHPNTLTYRIKQITELTGIDFDDIHERAELYSQLIAIRYIPDYYEFYRQQFS